MHFDLEIYFSGLCFFKFDYPAVDKNQTHDPARCAPESCTVLLVDTRKEYPCKKELGSRAPERHQPRMVVPAKNFIVGPGDVTGFEGEGFPLGVSETGEDLVAIDLTDTDVCLRPSDKSCGPLYVPQQRRRGQFSKPDDVGGRADWFDWIAQIQDIEDQLEGLKDPTPAVSKITFSSGELENFQMGQQRGENLLFEFRTVCGETPNGPPEKKKGGWRTRCLADRIVLRFRRLGQPLTVRLSKPCQGTQVFGIGASRPDVISRSPVTASITNLDARNHLSPRAIYDFLWYYELFEWKGTEKKVFERIIPWAPVSRHSGKTPSNGNCPPGG